MIEDGKPIGVVLTMEEYEKLQPSPKKDEVAASTETAVNMDELDFASPDDITLEDLGLDEISE